MELLDSVQDALNDNETNSEYIQELVDVLVNKCCDKLDAYISYVAGKLNEEDYVLMDSELDDIVMTIPIQLYFVGTQQEKLGIRHDVSEANRKLLYNRIYTDTVGTANVRKSAAELQLFNEDMVIVVYERAYNIIKSKVSFATELLQSAKKILSRRMAEFELSKVTPNKIRGD